MAIQLVILKTVLENATNSEYKKNIFLSISSKAEAIPSKMPFFDNFDDQLIMIPNFLDTFFLHMAAKRLKIGVFQKNVHLVAENENKNPFFTFS